MLKGALALEDMTPEKVNALQTSVFEREGSIYLIRMNHIFSSNLIINEFIVLLFGSEQFNCSF